MGREPHCKYLGSFQKTEMMMWLRGEVNLGNKGKACKQATQESTESCVATKSKYMVENKAKRGQTQGSLVEKGGLFRMLRGAPEEAQAGRWQLQTQRLSDTLQIKNVFKG